MTEDSKREFIQFLIKNNAYTNFRRNFYSIGFLSGKNHHKAWKAMTQWIYSDPKLIVPIRSLLSWSFMWDETIEGHHYWAELFDKAPKYSNEGTKIEQSHGTVILDKWDYYFNKQKSELEE